MSEEVFVIQLASRVKERRHKLRCVSRIAGDYRLMVDEVWLEFLSENDNTPDKNLAEKKLQEVAEILEIHGLLDHESENDDIVVTCYFTGENIMSTRLVYAIYGDASGEVQGDYYDYEDIVYDIAGYPFLTKLDQVKIRNKYSFW